MSAVLRAAKPPAEKDEQRAIVTVAHTVGFEVDSHSQYRASHIAPGVPDLYLTHDRLRIDAWFEVKPYAPHDFDPRNRATWTLKPRSAAQIKFGERLLSADVLYHWGGCVDFREFLAVLGLAYWTTDRVCVLTPQGGSHAQADAIRSCGLTIADLIARNKSVGSWYRQPERAVRV